MALHILKLAVGCESVKELRGWVAERMATAKKKGLPLRHVHVTRMTPKRDVEILAGGSLYWVIKGLVQVRQPLLDIDEGTKDDGTPCCLLILKNELVPVRPTPRRAFQGWRYLDPAEAPQDLGRSAAGSIVAMPPKLRKQLAELGLL